MIPRILTKTIEKYSRPGFINLIYGPRRVGKTVLLKQLIKNDLPDRAVWFNCDTQESRDALSTTSQIKLGKLTENADTVIIDEAQRIPNIGLSLKILIDNAPEKRFFVSGSSSLMLARGVSEPLTGRTIKYRLFPLSTKELAYNLNNFEKPALLSDQLRFGGYPYLQQLSSASEKQEYLRSIIDDYLFRDVLQLSDVSSPETLKKLAILLAFQIGSEVSLNELANNLLIDVKTVIRYLSLLKESFVIFEIGSLSRNLRKEIAKAKKYYFWDLGIRNALIDQFIELDLRPDLGALWESFLAVERIKKDEYERNSKKYYFWRTYEKAEIDWIEEKDGQLAAFEFKWRERKIKTPKAFKETYKRDAELISRENYLEFISG